MPLLSWSLALLLVGGFSIDTRNTDVNSNFELQQTIKLKAYNVLKSKCNFCHVKKRDRIIFTFDNMDSLSKVIEFQVFTKKKMPKGRKNKLSNLEEDKLISWIRSLQGA
jgi:biotin synthase-like enzyme